MKFIDMFCGIGTIRMGMEQAGHECVYSIEWDKHKRKIYKVVFGNEPEGSDIRRCTGAEIPAADVWCFGFPCQDISVAGKQLGLSGERSGLFYEVMRILQEIKEEDRPKYLFIENVKNLLSVNRGLDFFNLLYTLDEVGYNAEWQLLNSKDFGVPQNRERVFVIGHYRGRSTRKVFPIVTRMDCKNPAVTLTTRGYGSQRNGTYVVENPTKIKQLLNIMPTSTRENPNQGRVYDLSGIAPGLNKMEGGGRRPYIYQRPRGNNNGGLKEIAPTITKNSYEHNNHLITNGEIRQLTPKECWRLQGIQDEITDKVIAAGISDTQMYRGAGDACTVNVIYEVARRLNNGI